MTTTSHGSWTDDVSGRERVRAVVETLAGSATVDEIADRADVSRTTADDELERLEADNCVHTTLVDGKKGYELDPTRLFFDALLERITENTRAELEAELAQLTAERAEFETEFDADSLVAFRERLADDDELDGEEIRERHNVAVSWDTLNGELTIVRHALRLYDDVDEMATGTPDGVPAFS